MTGGELGKQKKLEQHEIMDKAGYLVRALSVRKKIEKQPKFQPAGLKSQTWGSNETTQPTLSLINLLCSTFLTLT